MAKRILVAEDDDDVRLYIQQLLIPEGYTVSVVDNGLDMLRLASGATPFDLIIADVNMPKGRGDSTLAMLRKQKIETPALLITGLNNPHAPKEVEVLNKPFNRRQLIEKIEKLIGVGDEA